MSASPTSSTRRGRLFMLLGLGLAVLGVVVFVVQHSLQRLWFPWYTPALALLGIAFIIASLWERRTVWRRSLSWRSFSWGALS